MKDSERFIYIIIVICAIIFAVSRVPDVEYNTIEIPGDTIFKTITKDSLIVDTFEFYNTDTLWMYDTIFKNDTVFVYNEFFKMNKYNDTIQNDSSITIIRDISITQNKIYQESYFTKNNRPVSIINSIDVKNRFGTGGIVGLDIIAPKVSYEYNNHEFSVGYNFVGGWVVFEYERKFNLK